MIKQSLWRNKLRIEKWIEKWGTPFNLVSLHSILLFVCVNSLEEKIVVLTSTYFIFIVLQIIRKTEEKERLDFVFWVFNIVLYSALIVMIPFIDFGIRMGILILLGYLLFRGVIKFEVPSKIIPPSVVSLIKFSFLNLILVSAWIFYLKIVLWYSTDYPSSWVISVIAALSLELPLFIFMGILCVWFTFDFLIKFIKSKPDKNDWKWSELIIQIFLALVFTDFLFSFIYIYFSPHQATHYILIPGNLDEIKIWINNFLRSFYYSFSLHFTIEVPNSGFYKEISESIVNHSYMKVIQFFHIVINKLVEFTIIVKIAGVVLGGKKNLNEVE